MNKKLFCEEFCMRKRFLLGALMLGLALAISGCGATGGVSQAEYIFL